MKTFLSSILRVASLLMLITVSACEYTAPVSKPVPAQPVSTPTPKRIELDPIPDGPRPASIKGAKLIPIHQFHEEEVSNDTWICIEGTVEHRDELFGAPRLLLLCPTCGTKVHCEGYQLDDYKLPKGSRVIVRGRVFHGNHLAESVPVSRDELTAALEKETLIPHNESPRLAYVAAPALRKPNVVVPLWNGDPPQFQADAPAEVIEPRGSIANVTRPAISVFLPEESVNTGMAIIVCPGGGYGKLDWKTHVIYAAEVFNRRGVTVIGLKYRTRPPFKGKNEEIQALTLLDAKRAVRLVRHRAREWKLKPDQIGIAGYSAGGNLAMNLAANFDAGDPNAADPIDRESSRPDFAIGLATWHWRQKTSPFQFAKNTPPVFLVHATNDGIKGGAPIELPREIAADLKQLGIPVQMAEFDVGAHGVGNLIPQRVKNGFPPAKWPDLFLDWYQKIETP